MATPRGHTLTKESGEIIAGDLRKRRFNYEPPRAVPKARSGGDGSRIKHVRAPAGGVAAFNAGTLTMGSATCTEYICSSSGVLTAGAPLVCYNAAGAVAANAFGLVMENEAGLWVWIVERC